MSPEIDINPVAAVLRQAKFFPQNTAFLYEGREWTYGRLAEESGALARALCAAGVQAGDRIAYLGLNSITFMETMLAAWWTGAVFEPLNFRLAPAEITGLLRQSTPKVMVVEPTHQDIVDRLLADTPAVLDGLTLVLVDNDDAAPAPAQPDHHYRALTAVVTESADHPLPDPVPAGSDDLAILMFTSGTTGQPKGVQLTHGNVWWNCVNVDSVVDTRRGDTNLATAPPVPHRWAERPDRPRARPWRANDHPAHLRPPAGAAGHPEPPGLTGVPGARHAVGHVRHR